MINGETGISQSVGIFRLNHVDLRKIGDTHKKLIRELFSVRNDTHQPERKKIIAEMKSQTNLQPRTLIFQASVHIANILLGYVFSAPEKFEVGIDALLIPEPIKKQVKGAAGYLLGTIKSPPQLAARIAAIRVTSADNQDTCKTVCEEHGYRDEGHLELLAANGAKACMNKNENVKCADVIARYGLHSHVSINEVELEFIKLYAAARIINGDLPAQVAAECGITKVYARGTLGRLQNIAKGTEGYRRLLAGEDPSVVGDEYHIWPPIMHELMHELDMIKAHNDGDMAYSRIRQI